MKEKGIEELFAAMKRQRIKAERYADKKESIIKYIVIILSVLNLIWLFGFEYRLPDLKLSGPEDTAVAATTAAAATPAEAAPEEVVEEPEEENGQKEEAIRCRVTVTNNLNIRSGPGTSYKVVGTASYEEILTVLGVEDGWVHVRNNEGVERYVSESFIEILEEEPE